MKILILEDDKVKLENIASAIRRAVPYSVIDSEECLSEFIKRINRSVYDLIVVDLVVPLFKDESPADVSDRIVEIIRDISGSNFYTPVVAITAYDSAMEEHISDLNKFDINLIKYVSGSDDWVGPFTRKVYSCVPEKVYDFVIVCALDEEARAYQDLGFDVGGVSNKSGIRYSEVSIGDFSGVLAVPHRMGLVNAAIMSSRAIDIFRPRLICMSGICAGIADKAKICDVVIPDICHQHDSGKWTNQGFVPEIYAVQLPHKVMTKIDEILADDGFLQDVVSRVSRCFHGSNDVVSNVRVYRAPTSSGSSVVASEAFLKEIAAQHRKMTAFEMESYAVYEAARQADSQPIYFSAKSVVDNGDAQKGDDFHRLGSLLSASVVAEFIARGIVG